MFDSSQVAPVKYVEELILTLEMPDWLPSLAIVHIIVHIIESIVVGRIEAKRSTVGQTRNRNNTRDAFNPATVTSPILCHTVPYMGFSIFAFSNRRKRACSASYDNRSTYGCKEGWVKKCWLWRCGLRLHEHCLASHLLIPHRRNPGDWAHSNEV